MLGFRIVSDLFELVQNHFRRGLGGRLRPLGGRQGGFDDDGFMNALLSLQRGLSLGKSPLRLFLLAPDFGDVDAQFIVVFLPALEQTLLRFAFRFGRIDFAFDSECDPGRI